MSEVGLIRELYTHWVSYKSRGCDDVIGIVRRTATSINLAHLVKLTQHSRLPSPAIAI